MTYRLVVASGFVPSDTVGGGLILYDLLGNIPRGDVAVVAGAAAAREIRARGTPVVGSELVPVPPFLERFEPRVQRLVNTLAIARSFRETSRLITSSSTVLAVPWRGQLGPEVFVGAVLAARRRNARLVVYEMDEWLPASSSGVSRVDGLLERVFHRMALRQAAHVWTVSSEMASRLRQRLGVDATVVPSAVDLSQMTATDDDDRPLRRPATMLFTGTVNGAQADALAGIAAVVRSRPDLVELELYTDVTEDGLRACGIPLGGNVRRREPLPHSQVRGLLRGADVLLLPFAFDAGQRDIVSTSYPTKVADYVAAGRPVLVHAPAYSTVARAARDDGWGLVADDADPSTVEKAIVTLLGDHELCRTLAANARAVAARDHDLAARRREVTAMLFGPA